MDTKLFSSEKPFRVMLIGKLFRNEDFITLESIVSRCIEENRKEIVFDLSRMTFINSQGLGMIVKMFRIINESGGDLRLFKPPKDIKEIIDISGISRIIPVFSSEEDS
ncbi:MAG: STAS domain-containing protein [Chitinivibrionales bacterium]|nr:STAS domain-containing protein [Chitinivibrionales bacterium]